MKAVIMAGGGGTRLRPLTCDRPKPMVPIMNKPMMEHIVKLLKSHDITEIGVTLQYMPEAIKDYFTDGSQWGVHLDYFIEDVPLGTAGSVKNASSFLDETFLVISGDALTDIDLSAAIKFHREKGSMATLVLTSVETPLEYGVVITSEDGKITRFLEKPSWGEVFSDTVNTGIYILEPEALDLFEQGVKFDFSKNLFPMILERKMPLYGYVAEGYWCDVGNLEQYQQAHYDILEGKVSVDIEGEQQEEQVWVGEKTQISTEAEIEGPLVIGNGCMIGPASEVKGPTVLGPGTIIEKESSVKQSILWQNVYIGKNAELRGTVFCNKVRLGNGASAFEGSVIGDESIVEEGSRIKPEMKIWPHKHIESGTIVHDSVIWGRKVSKNLFGIDGIKGVPNLEITPELAVQVGNAFGSLLGEDSLVMISSDDWGASRMLKQAFTSGLLAAGAKVTVMDNLLVPMARAAVKDLGAAGGVHIHRSPKEEDKISLKIFDEVGLNISKDWEKKIEQAYQREDYQRIQGEKVGEAVQGDNFLEKYKEVTLKRINANAVREANNRIVLAFAEPLVYTAIAPILKELNVETILYEPFTEEKQPLSRSEIRERIKRTNEVINEYEASLGVVVDRAGEELILIDDKERVVEGDYYTALISYILFKLNKNGIVAVPVNVSGVVEKIAERFSGKVVRTKTAPRFLMEEIQKQDLIDQFLLQYDAVAALAYIIQYLSQEDLRFSQLLDDIPEFHLTQKKIECSWGSKGKVMRRLIEENQGKEVEMIDGIKVRHPEGWALIIPDPDEPYYQVYSEGYNEEISESLTDLYLDKIKSIQKES